MVELGELWLIDVMGMVLLGVLDSNVAFVLAVLPVVGMLAIELTRGLTAVGFTGCSDNKHCFFYQFQAQYYKTNSLIFGGCYLSLFIIICGAIT